MSRVFKYSKFPVELFVPNIQDAHTLEKLSVSLYTDDPSISADFVDGFTVEGDIIKMIVPDTALCNIKQGVIRYAVQGYKDGVFFIVERQSNYFLKNPSEFSGPDAVEIVITENGVYEGLYNKITVDVHSSDYRVGSLYADFEDKDGEGNYWRYPSEDNVDVYDYVSINATNYGNQKYEDGYRQGKADGGSCNLQDKWVECGSPDELTDGVYVDVYPDEGYDGMSRVVADVRGLMQNKYDEGYNQGALDNGADGSIIGDIQISEMRTYFIPDKPLFQIHNGRTDIEVGYGNRNCAIEITFIPWRYDEYVGNKLVVGNDKVGLFMEDTNSGLIRVNFCEKSGYFTVDPYCLTTVKFDINGVEIDGNHFDYYKNVEGDFSDFDLGKLSLDGYGKSIASIKFWETYENEVPLYEFRPNPNTGLERSVGGGDFEEYGEIGENIYEFVKSVNVIDFEPRFPFPKCLYQTVYDYFGDEEAFRSDLELGYGDKGITTTKGYMFSKHYLSKFVVGYDEMVILDALDLTFAKTFEPIFVYEAGISIGDKEVEPTYMVRGFEGCYNIETIFNAFEGSPDCLRYIGGLYGLGFNLEPNQVLDFSPTKLREDALKDIAKTVYNFKGGPNAKGVPTAYVKFNENADESVIHLWEAIGWSIIK